MMNRSIRTIMLTLALIMAHEAGFLIKPPSVHAATSVPEYAKWGQIAMQQTKARYRADIVDYLHVGRVRVSQGVAEEVFKLRLREGAREFEVRVTIQFYTSNDRIITINFQETAN
ncbi:DUF3889 domain-containing protein [Cohnella luojiensis]|uniref:DUF3889 domain-containing protein n=1 Tax=Cohnella luojiensis TaxID=652876 RepID=A0A4Y8LQH9_9BACL|nr:DUF3889 domain-containing protein [Cohnella luojiensis]TFE22664.1 DUF3889 domain-containing protein [Cohnella luojiensis]